MHYHIHYHGQLYLRFEFEFEARRRVHDLEVIRAEYHSGKMQVCIVNNCVNTYIYIMNALEAASIEWKSAYVPITSSGGMGAPQAVARRPAIPMRSCSPLMVL